jgi:hypothetical protein
VFILSCSFTLPPPVTAPQPSFSVPMPLNVPGPEECEAEEDKWERVLRERKEAGREVKGDALRGLMAYIRVGRFLASTWISHPTHESTVTDTVHVLLVQFLQERKESPIALKEIPRTARMKFPTIAGQQLDESDERAMQVHERMLWMRTRDQTVAGEESNMQKVSRSPVGKTEVGEMRKADRRPPGGTVHLGVHLGLSVCGLSSAERRVVAYELSTPRHAGQSIILI